MISIENLSLSFKSREIFNDVSLEINEGIWLLEGDNGSGKSTLLKILNRDNIYNAEIPKHSKVDVHGKVIFLDNNRKIPLNLEEKDFAEYVFHINNLKVKYNQLHEGRPLSSYSTGELKLVTLRILSKLNFEVLLLDEYLTNFDDVNLEEVFKILAEIQANETIILSATHEKDVKSFFVNCVEIRDKKLEVTSR